MPVSATSIRPALAAAALAILAAQCSAPGPLARDESPAPELVPLARVPLDGLDLLAGEMATLEKYVSAYDQEVHAQFESLCLATGIDCAVDDLEDVIRTITMLENTVLGPALSEGSWEAVKTMATPREGRTEIVAAIETGIARATTSLTTLLDAHPLSRITIEDVQQLSLTTGLLQNCTERFEIARILESELGVIYEAARQQVPEGGA